MQELKILVADDNHDFYTLLKERIGNLHYNTQFLYAKNGYEALEIIREERVDLLITDFSMPVLNGMDLIRSLKSVGEYYRPKHIVVLSAYVEPGPPLKGMEHVIFLPKDDFYSELVHIVGELAEDNGHFDDEKDLYIRDTRVDIVGEHFVDIVHAIEISLSGVIVDDPHLIFDCDKDEVVDCILTLPGRDHIKTKGRVKRLTGVSEKYFKIEFFNLNRDAQEILENFITKEQVA